MASIHITTVDCMDISCHQFLEKKTYFRTEINPENRTCISINFTIFFFYDQIKMGGGWYILLANLIQLLGKHYNQEHECQQEI